MITTRPRLIIPGRIAPRRAPLWIPPRALFVNPISHYSTSTPPATPPALVQHVSANATSSAGGTISLAPSWPGATVAGRLLIAIYGVTSQGPTPLATITPPAGWTLAVSGTCDLGNGGGRIRLSIYYIENAASQSGTSSWTSSGGYMSGARAALSLLEYSGIVTSSSLDKTATGAAATNGGGFPYTNDTVATTGTTGATSQNSELCICGIMATPTLSSITGSFTVQETQLGSNYIAADRIVSATGTYVATMTLNTAGCFAGAMATFKGA